MTSMTSRHNFLTKAATAADQQQPLLQQRHQVQHPSSITQPPIDPPEDIIATDDRYYYDDSNSFVSQQQQQQRSSTSFNYDVDAIVKSLSLRPPDPPGFSCSSLGKRKFNSHYKDTDEGSNRNPSMPALATKKSKVTEPLPIPSILSDALASSPSTSSSPPLSLPVSVIEATAPTSQQIIPLNGSSGGVSSSSVTYSENLIDEIDEAEEVDNETMSIDDSSSCSSSSNNDNNGRNEDHSDDNSSIVSESSIRNAMYQLVFGRLSMHSAISGGAVGGGTVSGASKYDAVDSKIEDLIRRSRLEATIEGRKEKERSGGDRCVVGVRSITSMSSSDMDMDDEDDAVSEAKQVGERGERRHDAVDDGWTPGHG